MLKLLSVIFAALLLSYSLCCGAQETSVISGKAAPVIANLLSAKDPFQFAKSHNIEIKDGMLKVVMKVDEKLLPKDLILKYELKEFRINNNLANVCIGLDMLKKILEEPGIIFVRMPFKLRPLFK